MRNHYSQKLYSVTVDLDEKKWYKFYVGGGINADDLSSVGSASNSAGFGSLGGGGATGAALSVLPKLQFETSASLLNLTGFADVSSASYSVDPMGSSAFRFVHDRPLCSYLSEENPLYRWLMPEDPRTINHSDKQSNGSGTDTLKGQQLHFKDHAQYPPWGGSQASLGLHAICHDVDHEFTRSSKEFVRSVGMRLANHTRGAVRDPSVGGAAKPSIGPPDGMAGPYLFLDWDMSLRDVLPKRCGTHPFALDCSTEVAQLAGTRLKHALSGGLYLNGHRVDDRYEPTQGYDAHCVVEVAGPPGDVGFVKVKGGFSSHFPVGSWHAMASGVNSKKKSVEEDKEEEFALPLGSGMALHSSFNCGILRPLAFGGQVGSQACSTVPLSDRFHVGGPGQLRGFLPAGIGPRAHQGGSSVPGGDALGGDVFYASTLAASMPFPTYFTQLQQSGARLFGFANAGTCVSAGHSPPSLGWSFWNQVLQSSRVAIGCGVSMASSMGRFEATYAVPLRYGPRDARKSVQFGFGFSFG